MEEEAQWIVVNLDGAPSIACATDTRAAALDFVAAQSELHSITRYALYRWHETIQTENPLRGG